MLKRVEDIIQYYHKFYTQYYTGDLDFTGYVIESLCEDMKIGDVSAHEVKHTLYILLAALLYEKVNKEKKND